MLVFGVLILVHELGHYIAARIFGVHIFEFAIGMGPKIFSKTSKKTGIAYSLRLFPIGGFVSMAGEDEESEEEGALCNKPVWQRMIITVSGAVMNLILGFILITAMVLSMNTLRSNVVLKFESLDYSYRAGLREGDEIIKINNRSTHIYGDLSYEILHKGDEPVDITVIRDGQKVVINDVEFPKTSEEGITFGVMDFYTEKIDKSFLNVAKYSFYQSVSSIKLVWDSLVDLISGKYGFEQVSGPIGTSAAIGQAARQSRISFFYLCGVIAMNLGIFNLIPFPALDGGRLAFQTVELIRRKPISANVEGYIHFAGIVLLMIFMVVVAFKDVFQFFA